MIQNSIGDYFFINYDRPPGAPQQHLIDKARPGVAGKAFWRQGIWGDGFVVKTLVDTVDLPSAYLLIGLYRLLIGANPVPLVYAGMNSETYGFKVQVKDVRPIVIARDLVGTAGIAPANPGKGRLVAEWTLVPVAT